MTSLAVSKEQGVRRDSVLLPVPESPLPPPVAVQGPRQVPVPPPSPSPILRNDNRCAVPTKEEQAAALKEVKARFADLYRTNSQLLGSKLFEHALSQGKQSFAERYIALKEFTDLRASEGAVGGSQTGSEQIASMFQVDSLLVRTEAAEAAALNVNPLSVGDVAVALRVVAEARGNDRLDLAARLANVALAVAAKGNLEANRALAEASAKEILEDIVDDETLRDAPTRLRTNRNDAATHRLVGQLRCRQGRWGLRSSTCHKWRTRGSGIWR
jgi:hypothetical protein